MRDLLTALTRRSRGIAAPRLADRIAADAVYTVSIGRRLERVFDRASGGLRDDEPGEIYSGPAVVTLVAPASELFLGEEEAYFDAADVVLPRDQVNVVPMRNDIVVVLDGPEPALVRRAFRIRGLEMGGLFGAGLTLHTLSMARTAERVATDEPG